MIVNIGWEGVQIQMMKNEINADHSKPLLLTDGLPLILPLQGVKHDSKPCRNISIVFLYPADAHEIG
jgi:hypothetical protein